MLRIKSRFSGREISEPSLQPPELTFPKCAIILGGPAPDTQELIGKYYFSYKNKEHIPTFLR